MADEADAILAKYGAAPAPTPAPRPLTAPPALAAAFGAPQAAPVAAAPPAAPAPVDEGEAILAKYGGTHAATPAEPPHDPSRWQHFTKGLSALASSIRHPIDTATDPHRRREMLRGVDDMVTLGYGQQLADYIGTKLGDTQATALGATAPADAAAAPGYRTAGSFAGAIMPGAVSHIAKETGAVLGGLTGAAGGIGANAARGAVGYAASAAPIAGLSAGASGHRLEAAKDAALDPVGIGLSAALGGVAGGLKAPIGKAIDRSAERQSEGILREIAAGDELHGSATKTARMLLDRDKKDIIATVAEDPELARAVKAKAVEALPVIHSKMDHWGSQLDPLYDVKDAATGGVSLGALVRYADSKALEMSKKPLNEKYVDALHDIRDSALKAWAPDLAGALESEEARTSPAIKHRVLEAMDVKVPTRDVREMVTRLQKRGSQVINPLNPGEASIMKADMARMMFEFLDRDLDSAAKLNPETKAAVTQIREVNKRYSALSNINKAIEQRGWKESTGNRSLMGHATDLLSHGGAGYMLLHGNIPGAVGAYAAGKLAPPAFRIGEAMVNRGGARLSEASQAGNKFARFARDAIELQSPARIGQLETAAQGSQDR